MILTRLAIVALLLVGSAGCRAGDEDDAQIVSSVATPARIEAVVDPHDQRRNEIATEMSELRMNMRELTSFCGGTAVTYREVDRLAIQYMRLERELVVLAHRSRRHAAMSANDSTRSD